jgi:hypothetical protein
VPRMVGYFFSFLFYSVHSNFLYLRPSD